jgi:hypothetical protein
MRWLLVALLGCHHAAPAPALVEPRPAAPACNATTCPADQYCIESTVHGGMPPEPGEPPNISTSVGCSAALPAPSQAGHCSAPEGKIVRCEYAAP